MREDDIVLEFLELFAEGGQLGDTEPLLHLLEDLKLRVLVDRFIPFQLGFIEVLGIGAYYLHQWCLIQKIRF